jgi:hypothetical protein
MPTKNKQPNSIQTTKPRRQQAGKRFRGVIFDFCFRGPTAILTVAIDSSSAIPSGRSIECFSVTMKQLHHLIAASIALVSPVAVAPAPPPAAASTLSQTLLRGGARERRVSSSRAKESSKTGKSFKGSPRHHSSLSKRNSHDRSEDGGYSCCTYYTEEQQQQQPLEMTQSTEAASQESSTAAQETQVTASITAAAETQVTASATTQAAAETAATTTTSTEPNNMKCNVSPEQYEATVRQIILIITPEEVLDDVKSPQAMALHWLLHEDRIDPPVCPPPPASAALDDDKNEAASTTAILLQRYIMSSFYFATNGHNWRECNAPIDYTSASSIHDANTKCTRTITVQSTESLLFVLEEAFHNDTAAGQQQQHTRKIGTDAWLTPVDTCEWGGLACSYNHVDNRDGEDGGGGFYSIDQIEFEDNNLSGTLIPELSTLSSQLRFLILEKGQLHGPIPKEYGALTNLRVLDLDYNNLSGIFPNELYDLEELRELDLNDNKLSGTISSRIGMLRNLDFLQFDHNEFVGEIPDEVGELKQLSKWYFSCYFLFSLEILLILTIEFRCSIC